MTVTLHQWLTALFADKVTCLSTTKFGVHRADMYVETDDEKKMPLSDTNNDIRAAFESKLNEDAFTKITGKTFDQIFTESPRPTVWLSADNAVAIGLVNQEDVLVLTPKIAADLSSKFVMHMGAYEEPENKQTSNNNKNNDKKMEAQEITAIANEATAKEKARVDAWGFC